MAENRGSGISMMISRVRRDTGLVPLFAANLDYFRVTIPRTSAVTPELRAWAIRLSRGEDLSEAQVSALALASAGNDVDVALLRRLGLGPSDARRQLGQLRDLGLLSPRKARDDGSCRLAPGLPAITAGPKALSSPGGGLPERILRALGEAGSASREERETCRAAWPWLPVSTVGQCGPDEWYVVVHARLSGQYAVISDPDAAARDDLIRRAQACMNSSAVACAAAHRTVLAAAVVSHQPQPAADDLGVPIIRSCAGMPDHWLGRAGQSAMKLD